MIIEFNIWTTLVTLGFGLFFGAYWADHINDNSWDGDQLILWPRIVGLVVMILAVLAGVFLP